MENIDLLALNCFSIGSQCVIDQKTQWENSASQQLAEEAYKLFEQLSQKNCSIESNESLSVEWLKPDTISYEFQRMLAKVLMESASPQDMPIVWKTIPSRRNKFFGEYATVKIDTQVFPLITETIDDDSCSSNAAEAKRNFNQVFKLKFGPSSESKFYEMSFTLFLLHILMKDTFGNMNKQIYTQDNLRVALKGHLCTSLDVSNWYPNLEVIKTAKLHLSNPPDKIDAIQKYIEEYKTNVETTKDELIMVFDSQGIEGVCSVLKKGINSDLIDFICEFDCNAHM